jgi:hypothetical protein
MIKSRRMGWVRLVECMGGEERCIQGFGGETMRERDHLEIPGLGERIILRWIFRNWFWGVGARIESI